MNGITFARIHKEFLETYTLEECAYSPNQKQYIELKAKVKNIMAERCQPCHGDCVICKGEVVDKCTRDFPVEEKS